jgi:hypothetical protein
MKIEGSDAVIALHMEKWWKNTNTKIALLSKGKLLALPKVIQSGWKMEVPFID